MHAINERIAKLVEKYADGNKTRFAKAIGASDTNVRMWSTTDRMPSCDVLETICRTFNVSAEWMLLGEGEMKKQESVAPLASEEMASVLGIIEEIKTQLENMMKENQELRKRNEALVDKLLNKL